jgi:hypothetical protein
MIEAPFSRESPSSVLAYFFASSSLSVNCSIYRFNPNNSNLGMAVRVGYLLFSEIPEAWALDSVTHVFA